MVISVTISQTIRQNSVVLLFGTPKESKSYLIIVLQEWRLRVRRSVVLGGKKEPSVQHICDNADNVMI